MYISTYLQSNIARLLFVPTVINLNIQLQNEFCPHRRAPLNTLRETSEKQLTCVWFIVFWFWQLVNGRLSRWQLRATHGLAILLLPSPLLNLFFKFIAGIHACVYKCVYS